MKFQKATEQWRKDRRRAFCEAVTHPEFSHVEVQIVAGTRMVVAYRHDPASAAGKGWIGALPFVEWFGRAA
jgi:hypothetical protein